MSDQAVLLPKWSPNRRIILAKRQLDHSYTFWTMANYTTAVCPDFFETDVTSVTWPCNGRNQKLWFKMITHAYGIVLCPELLFALDLEKWKWGVPKRQIFYSDTWTGQPNFLIHNDFLLNKPGEEFICTIFCVVLCL